MSKHSEKSKHKQAAHPPRPPADGLTIGWMLTLITGLACSVGALALRAYVQFIRPGAEMIQVLSGLLLFAAAIVGVVLLILTPIIVQRKRSHPPRWIVRSAYVIGVAPWLFMIWQGLG
jgi:hypothetical protein